MSNQDQEKTVDTQQQTATDEPALDAATWLAPFNSATFISLQNTIGNRALSQLLQADPAHLGQNGNGNGNGNGHTLGHGAKSIQKGAQQDAPERTEQTPVPEAPPRTLIVEDDAQDLQPGQMQKTEFLDRLKTSVCGAAEEVLRNTMWSAMGCPYIERWFSHYGAQSSQHVERALRLYAPETARATSAEAIIPIVTERVRRGLSQWAETGERTGVPEKFREGEMPGVTLHRLVSGALTGLGRAIGTVFMSRRRRTIRKYSSLHSDR